MPTRKREPTYLLSIRLVAGLTGVAPVAVETLLAKRYWQNADDSGSDST